jgi:hypothetical protein
MRRIRDSRPGTTFRGNELPRLLTLVVMLGVLFLLIDRARDPSTWRWLTRDADRASVDTALPEGARSVAAPDTPSNGPTDEDPEERDAAREEFEAVTDKGPLAKEEMPAYWRLLEWEQHQSLAQLRRRATREVSFRELWQQPEKWRGRLIEIPVVHLKQTAELDDLAENRLGLKKIYEAWGWNSESQPYCYWLVCPQLPPGMPSGANTYEEATFVGYFLKLLPYEDHEGKTPAVPLLIGRLIWHPSLASVPSPGEWDWRWFVAAGLALAFVARWLLAGRRSGRAPPAGRSEHDVNAWLEDAEESHGERPAGPPVSGGG